MTTTLGVIQVDKVPCRSRLPVDRLLAGKPLLEWVVRRVSECQLISGIVVAFGDEPSSRQLAELVPPDVLVHFGNETDLLKRIYDVVQEQPCDAIVRIGADNPLIDPALVDALITKAEATPGCDYATYCLGDGSPAIFSPLGILAEWFTAKSLRRAHLEATDTFDRERGTRYFYQNPDKFTVKLVRLPEQLDREDIRLTVDSVEDWERTQELYEALGPEQLDWQRITGFLDQQPKLRKKMADQNRRTA